jgi:hypothetical protein
MRCYRLGSVRQTAKRPPGTIQAFQTLKFDKRFKHLAILYRARLCERKARRRAPRFLQCIDPVTAFARGDTAHPTRAAALPASRRFPAAISLNEDCDRSQPTKAVTGHRTPKSESVTKTKAATRFLASPLLFV